MYLVTFHSGLSKPCSLNSWLHKFKLSDSWTKHLHKWPCSWILDFHLAYTHHFPVNYCRRSLLRSKLYEAKPHTHNKPKGEFTLKIWSEALHYTFCRYFCLTRFDNLDWARKSLFFFYSCFTSILILGRTVDKMYNFIWYSKNLMFTFTFPYKEKTFVPLFCLPRT